MSVLKRRSTYALIWIVLILGTALLSGCSSLFHANFQTDAVGSRRAF